MRRIFHENGLSICLFSLFLVSLLGQTVAGHLSSNEERIQHGEPSKSDSEYLLSSHSLEAVMENWESEFLQLFAYIVLTRDPAAARFGRIQADGRRAVLRGGGREGLGESPWPVRRGGWVRSLYAHSLSIAFLVLFLVAFGLHLVSGAAEYNDDLVQHGGAAIPTLTYLARPRFWFESFQNWQSEFFSIGLMVVFSIFLREKGSPESKPLTAPQGRTGSE